MKVQVVFFSRKKTAPPQAEKDELYVIYLFSIEYIFSLLKEISSNRLALTELSV